MSSLCLNDGQLILDQSSNHSYCQCNSCFHGVNCAELIPNKQQVQFNTDYVWLIIYLTALCLSILNNLFSLEVFLGCKSVSRTNTGVYLVLYSITSIIGSTLLAVDQYVQYTKPYPFTDNQQLSETFHCFLRKSGDQVTLFICLWLSALVALENSLIICLYFKKNATRWRSVITLVLFFCIATPISITMLVYRCEWNVPHKTQKARATSRLFYTVTFLAGVVYTLATLLVLVSCASYRYHCGIVVQQSKQRIFAKLLREHWFVFIPPIIYLLGIIPYQIWYPLKGPRQKFLQCGISTTEYTFKVIIQALPSIPTVITWLIFVYPSKVYMTEFYKNTLSGRLLWNLKHFLKEKTQRQNNVCEKHIFFIRNAEEIGYQPRTDEVPTLFQYTKKRFSRKV